MSAGVLGHRSCNDGKVRCQSKSEFKVRNRTLFLSSCKKILASYCYHRIVFLGKLLISFRYMAWIKYKNNVEVLFGIYQFNYDRYVWKSPNDETESYVATVKWLYVIFAIIGTGDLIYSEPNWKHNQLIRCLKSPTQRGFQVTSVEHLAFSSKDSKERLIFHV